ncbi:MAG: rhomboid family intramembrane serine protease [Mycoplasmatales bacterium]
MNNTNTIEQLMDYFIQRNYDIINYSQTEVTLENQYENKVFVGSELPMDTTLYNLICVVGGTINQANDKTLIISGNTANEFIEKMQVVRDQANEKIRQKTTVNTKLNAVNILIIINLVFFIVQFLSPILLNYSVIIGQDFSFGNFLRILTAGFTHSGFLHLALNMFFLMYIGTLIEQVSGTKKFLLVYFLTMIASGIIVIFFSSAGTFTVGASGALYGIMTFGAVYYRLSKVYYQPQLSSNLLQLIIINVFLSFALNGISISGHLGGLLAGIAVAVIFSYVEDLKNKGK